MGWKRLNTDSSFPPGQSFKGALPEYLCFESFDRSRDLRGAAISNGGDIYPLYVRSRESTIQKLFRESNVPHFRSDRLFLYPRLIRSFN